MRNPQPSGPEVPTDGPDFELHVTAQLWVSEDEAVPLPARLTYNITQPFGVLLDFPLHPQHISPWWFARDLLLTGLQAPAGEGDVQVWPWHKDGRSCVRILLQGGDACAVLDLPHESVRQWTRQTLNAVPCGAESELICWDSILDTLLSDH